MCLLTTPLVLASGGDPSPTHSEGEVSVLGFNVQFDSPDIDKSIELLSAADADILCLTEVTPAFAAKFEGRLRQRYPSRHLYSAKGTWGVGIASRYPLSSVRKFEQRPHTMPAVEAIASIRDRKVQVVCPHLFPPVAKRHKTDGFLEMLKENADLRRRQAESLVARYKGSRLPILLVGDMNEPSDGKAIAAFEKAGFIRSCLVPASKCGSTFPGASSVLPAVWEIDHILGRGVTFTSARMIKGGGSDHYPVTATFTLP